MRNKGAVINKEISFCESQKSRHWCQRQQYLQVAVCTLCNIINTGSRRSQDGRGMGLGDHFLPYKFIKRTFERWANFTKQLLNASRRHQLPRKAAHHLQKVVGQNIRDKERDNSATDGDPSREESRDRGSFQTPGNPLTGGSGGSFRISKGNLTGRKNK